MDFYSLMNATQSMPYFFLKEYDLSIDILKNIYVKFQFKTPGFCLCGNVTHVIPH